MSGLPFGVGSPLGADGAVGAAAAAQARAPRDFYVDPQTNRLALTSTGDLRMSQDDADGLAQALRQRCKLQKKEWFLAEQDGMPWFPDPDTGQDGLLGSKSFDVRLARAYLRTELQAVARAREVVAMGFTEDTNTRDLGISFVVDSEFGVLEGRA